MTAEFRQRRIGPGTLLRGRDLVIEPLLPGAAQTRDQVVGCFGADFTSETGSTFPNQQFVRQPAHDLARNADRVEEALQRADSTGAQCRVSELAQSVIDLAGVRHVAIDPALAEKVAAATAEAATIRNLQKALRVDW